MANKSLTEKDLERVVEKVDLSQTIQTVSPFFGV